MMEASSADCSTLKDTILKMWVPAIGVQTVPDLLAKYYEKLFECLLEMINLPRDFTSTVHDRIKITCEYMFERFVFKTNFESYFDTQPPFQLGDAILTGSLSEGLFLYTSEPPDMDLMCVLKNIMFSQQDQENGSLLLREDTPFVYTFITNKETQNFWSEFLEEVDKKGGKPRLSSKKLKQKLEENYQKRGGLFRTYLKEELQEVPEGAAVTVRKPKPVVFSFERMTEFTNELFRQPINELWNLDEEFVYQMFHTILDQLVPSIDIVLSIFCEGWPPCAREWTTRKRLWPDMHSVEKITQSGFHIVPKSSPDGDFRLSFSCAETILVKSLSPLQHKVMRAFKAVVKYHESTWSPFLKDIISSYHLKTIAFWHFEKTSQEPWSEETLVHHLVILIEELAEALRIQNIPMYFMPNVNLLKDIDNSEVMLELMERISQLSHDFSSMSEAVSNKNTLKELSIDLDSDHDTVKRVINNIFDTLREEKNKKTEEGGESQFTVYDVYVAMKNLGM